MNRFLASMEASNSLAFSDTRKVSLGGLLASIARLRFTGTPILKPFRDRAQWIFSERSTVS